MQRLFGGKKPEAPRPTVADATDSANKREQVLAAKIKDLDKQLNDFKIQLKTSRSGPAQTRIKQRAMQVLKQKRLYESQQDQLRGMVSNLDQAKFATENVQSALYQAEAMKASTEELKMHMKKVDINKLQDDMDDLADLMGETNEIQEILSRSYAVDDDIDEAELEDELAALDDELALETELGGDVPEYLKDQPAPAAPRPTSVPAAPAAPAGARPARPQELDEFGLPAM